MQDTKASVQDRLDTHLNLAAGEEGQEHMTATLPPLVHEASPHQDTHRIGEADMRNILPRTTGACLLLLRAGSAPLLRMRLLTVEMTVRALTWIAEGMLLLAAEHLWLLGHRVWLY